MRNLYISGFLSVAQTVITIQSEPLLIKDMSKPPAPVLTFDGLNAFSDGQCRWRILAWFACRSSQEATSGSLQGCWPTRKVWLACSALS